VNQVDFQLPVPTNPPDAGSIIGVIFGADWIPIILSALELLRFEELWLSPPTDIIPQIDELMERIANPVIIQPQAYPRQITHFHKFSLVSMGSAIVGQISSAYEFSTAWYQSAHAVGDRFEFWVNVDAGSYDFSFLGTKSVSAPILTILIDGAAITSIDLYAASPAFNSVVTVTLTFATAGNHKIEGLVSGKNTLANDYFVVCTAFILRKQ